MSTRSTLIVDGKPASADALGWAPQLAGYPPLLSHNELEHALDREQSKLYDALAGILGLGDLAAAQQVLQRARLDREHDAKEARDALPALRALLDRTSDERAAVVASRSPRRRGISTWLRARSAATPQSDERSVLRKLRDLAGLPVLDRERLNASDHRARARRMPPPSGCAAPTPDGRTRWHRCCSRRSTCTHTPRVNAARCAAPRVC